MGRLGIVGTIAGFLAVALALVLAGCGGGGKKGTTTSSPETPVIANLVVTSLGVPCVVGGTSGTGFRHTLDFTDADGDLRGGTLELRTEGNVSGSSTDSAPIPSEAVSITGTTSGQITFTSCVHFGSNSRGTERVKVADAAGHESNEVSAEFGRPAGAPERLRSTDPDPLTGRLGR